MEILYLAITLIKGILKRNTVQLITLCGGTGNEAFRLRVSDYLPRSFSIAELFGEEAIKETYRSVIRFAEQNCLWCLIINVGIGTEELTLGLADYILSFGKNIMIGC